MASDFDRAEVLRGLQILYPDHGIIELDVLKKSGKLLSGRFDDWEKLLDEILKNDGQNDTAAIYTALNSISPEAFSRPEHPLEMNNRVAGGLRIDATDVSRVTGILFDLDPFRTNGDKKDSTTEEEHAAAVEAADWLKHRLSSMGWPEPVMGSSGNGAALRYLTDLPAAEETERLIASMFKAANSLLPDQLKAQVEVDGAMFDRPRISKVLGTTTRKGPGTQERPWRRSKIISAPEKLEPVQIDSLLKLIAAGKAVKSADEQGEDAVPIKLGPLTKPLSEVEKDRKIRPCLKEIVLKTDIKKLEEVAAHEHRGRVAIAAELICAGYSDEALHEFFSKLDDYDHGKTQYQLNNILAYVEKGGKPWRCAKLRENEVVPKERCKTCKWGFSGAPPRVEWAEGFFVNPSGRTMFGTVKDEEHKAAWISDGFAYLDSILEAYNTSNVDRHFVIKGKGFSADREFKIVIRATDASEGRKLRAVLVNEFGRDPLGELDLATIQRLSAKEIRYIRLFNRPIWLNDRLVAPGLTNGDTEFNFERKVAVDFRSAGDLEEGKKAFKNALNGWEPKNVILLAASILGAPVIAKLWPDDRFALFMQAETGTMKTTAAMLLMSIYGPRYSIEANLVRWGDGATSNATEHIAAKTGPFPFVLDNYKAYSDQDPVRLQRIIHAILEGTEKDRLNRESLLRQGDEYLCTPIITGENFPGNDAATRARIVQIEWSDAIDQASITEAQRHITDLNAFGKAWLTWLNSSEGQQVMKEQADRFDEARTDYLKKVQGAINAGRIATNAAVIMLAWEVFGQWPAAREIAEKCSPILKEAVEEHVLRTQDEVKENLDAEKFISWLRAELSTGKLYISDPPFTPPYSNISEKIGFYNPTGPNNKAPEDELLILPDVLGSKLLPAWQRATNGVRADKKSLLRQLTSRGYLKYDEEETRYTFGRRIDGKIKRVHVFVKILDALQGEEPQKEEEKPKGEPWWGEDSPYWGLDINWADLDIVDEEGNSPLPKEEPPVTEHSVTENRDAEGDVTGFTAVTEKKGQSFHGEKNKDNLENEKQLDIDTGNTGNTGNNIELDNDFSVTKALPVQQSTGDSSGVEVPVSPAARRPIRLDPEAPESVLILKDYRTQISSPDNPMVYKDRLFLAGETVTFPRWQAVKLVERGIGQIVEASA